MRYSGYVVDKHGLRVDLEKMDAIEKTPDPGTLKEVRFFIGLASWYRRFVPNFSAVFSSLGQLLRKNSKFVWSSECHGAFKTVKECLVSAPLLSCLDFASPFTVQTDSSDFGLGVVLSQHTSDGEKVVCCLSRSLTKAESKYSTTEKELWCLLWS